MVLDEIEKLPLHLQQEVLDFAEFLKLRYEASQSDEDLSFSWAGGLAALRDEFSSVELQHKASEWR